MMKGKRAKKETKSEAAERPSSGKGQNAVYRLKITLRDIRPPIWRRVEVPDCSLAKLHEVIQVAMGWENYHLYSFEIGREQYTDPGGARELDMRDASRAKLSQVIPGEKAKFRYTYDFGDNWEHEILVETITTSEQRTAPVCLDGKRACPPEDVGGAWGYVDYVEAIRDPHHEQHEELLEWGGEFDPEAFDLDAVNQDLKRL